MRPFLGVGSNIMTSLVKKNQRKAFSTAEDLRLAQLVQIHGQDKWDTIAFFMEGRSARACRERWRLFLSPGLTNGPWSQEEDNLLIKLFNDIGPKWKQISTYFNGRSECNIKNRWTRHLKQMIQEDEKREQVKTEKKNPPEVSKDFEKIDQVMLPNVDYSTDNYFDSSPLFDALPVNEFAIWEDFC